MATAVEPIYTFTKPSEDGQMISYQRRVSSIINGVMDDDDIEVIDPYTKKRRSEEQRAKRESSLSAGNIDNPYQIHSKGHSIVAGSVGGGAAPSSGGMSRLPRVAIPEAMDEGAEATVSQISQNFVGGAPPPPPPPPPPPAAVVMRTKAREDGGEDMREAIARMAGVMSDRNAEKDPSEIYSGVQNRAASPPPAQSGGIQDELKRLLDQRKNGVPVSEAVYAKYKKKPPPAPPQKRMSRMTSPSTVGNEDYQPSVIQSVVVPAAATAGVYAAPSLGMDNPSVLQHSAPSVVDSASSFAQPVIVNTAAEVYSPPSQRFDSASILEQSASIIHQSPPSKIQSNYSVANFSPAAAAESAIISAPSVINSHHSILNPAPILNSEMPDTGFQPVVAQAASLVHQPLSNHGVSSVMKNASSDPNDMQNYFSSIGLNAESALSDLHNGDSPHNDFATSMPVNQDLSEVPVGFDSANNHIPNRALEVAESFADDRTNDGLDGVMNFSNNRDNFSSAEAVANQIVPASTPIINSAPMITVVSHSPAEQSGGVVGELVKVRKPKQKTSDRESTISGAPPSVYGVDGPAEVSNLFTSGNAVIHVPETTHILNGVSTEKPASMLDNLQPAAFTSSLEHQKITTRLASNVESNVQSIAVRPLESALGIEKANSIVDHDEIDQIYSAIRNPMATQAIPAAVIPTPIVAPQISEAQVPFVTHQQSQPTLQKPFSANRTLDKPQVLALRYAGPRRLDGSMQPLSQSASQDPDEDEILRMLDTVCDVEEAKNFDFIPTGNLISTVPSSGVNNLGAIVRNDSLNRKKSGMAALENKFSPFEVNSDSDFQLEEAMAINVQTPKKYQHFDTPNFKQAPIPDTRKSIQEIQNNFLLAKKPQEVAEISPIHAPQSRSIDVADNMPMHLLDDDDDLNNNWLLAGDAKREPKVAAAADLNKRYDLERSAAAMVQGKQRDMMDYIDSQQLQYEGQAVSSLVPPQMMSEQDYRGRQRYRQEPGMVTYKRQEENGQPKLVQKLKAFITGKQKVEGPVEIRNPYPYQMPQMDATLGDGIEAGQKYIHAENAEHLHSNQAGILQAKQVGFVDPIPANYSGQMQADQREIITSQPIGFQGEYPGSFHPEGMVMEAPPGQIPVQVRSERRPGVRQRTLSEPNIRRSPWNVLQSFFHSNKNSREEFVDREVREYPPEFAQSLPPNYSNIAAFRYSSTSSPFQQNRMEMPMGVGNYTGRHTVGGGCIHSLRNLGLSNQHQLGRHQQFGHQLQEIGHHQPMGHHHQEIGHQQPIGHHHQEIGHRQQQIYPPVFPDRFQEIRNLPNFVLQPSSAKIPEVLKVHADYHPGSSREGITHISAPLLGGDQGIASSHLHIQTPLVNNASQYLAVQGASPNLHPNISVAPSYPPSNKLVLQTQF